MILSYLCCFRAGANANVKYAEAGIRGAKVSAYFYATMRAGFEMLE